MTIRDLFLTEDIVNLKLAAVMASEEEFYYAALSFLELFEDPREKSRYEVAHVKYATYRNDSKLRLYVSFTVDEMYFEARAGTQFLFFTTLSISCGKSLKTYLAEVELCLRSFMKIVQLKLAVHH